MMQTIRINFVMMLAVALLASGCGYRNGSGGGDINGTGGGGKIDAASSGSSGSTGYQWKSIYRPDVRSVAVPIFKSVSFARGVEFSLSKALVTQIEANTPYKVLPRERADTILEGEIVEVSIATLSNDRRSAIPQEQLLDVRINFIWKDLRTGRILVERRNLERTASFYPTLGEGRFTGTQEATERLALAIVQELQADW
ncbi:MAG: LPS assembly lipoprotein LptE [Tepidisphaeraceae bacterium]